LRLIEEEINIPAIRVSFRFKVRIRVRIRIRIRISIMIRVELRVRVRELRAVSTPYFWIKPGPCTKTVGRLSLSVIPWWRYPSLRGRGDLTTIPPPIRLGLGLGLGLGWSLGLGLGLGLGSAVRAQRSSPD